MSNGQISTETIEASISQKYLGGLGIGAKILYEETQPGIDPLGPDNILVISTGCLSGTNAPTNGRTEIITKSPLTGNIGRGNFGGWWGPRLKHAGFEVVVIKGKASDSVYVWINDGRVALEAPNAYGDLTHGRQ